MLCSLPGTPLACGSAPCRPYRPQCCLVQRRQLSLQPQQICRVPQAAPHHSALLMRRSTMQVSNIVAWQSGFSLCSSQCCHADGCHAHCLLCPCCQGGRCVSVQCAAAADEQPTGQSKRESTKQCERCGDTRTLFYFPVRKSHPGGWVHCFACQHEQLLEARPPRRCALQPLDTLTVVRSVTPMIHNVEAVGCSVLVVQGGR
jgi:hypothetical protein